MKKIVGFLILTFCMLALLSAVASAQASMGMGAGIYTGSETVTVGTLSTWIIRIDISTAPEVGNDIKDVVVQGGIGADLVVTKVNDESVTPLPLKKGDTFSTSSGDVTLTKKGGKMGATIVTWDIGDLDAGDEATLYLTVQTGLNPPGKQEFTSTGTHELDGGFSATYWFEGTEYESVPTDPIIVEAIEE